MLEKYDVELIGADIPAIQRGEDRQIFKDIVRSVGGDVPRSAVCHTLDEVRDTVAELGLPVVIRPSFTMGGLGSGMAYTAQDLERIASTGLAASPVHEVLIEESVLGWKEYELELMRDAHDNMVVVCSIENIDPMGVHTGDSMTVAPAMTLTDREYQDMRDLGLKILRAVGVATGGCNIQFGIEPSTGRMVVIEMNPRVSRSSALASKATGFPIAKIAAKLAIGYTLDEIANDITKATPAAFEPSLDYVVVKIPRFAFEKFPGADPTLTTTMKSVGEAMSIGRSFAEALGKAMRSMETKVSGFWTGPCGGDRRPGRASRRDRHPDRRPDLRHRTGPGLGCQRRAGLRGHQDRPVVPRADQADRVGRHFGSGRDRTGRRAAPDGQALRTVGPADRRAAAGTRAPRRPCASCVGRSVCGRCSRPSTPAPRSSKPLRRTTTRPTRPIRPRSPRWPRRPSGQKIIILGSGPNRIGQGIEFDYSCVHAALALAGGRLRDRHGQLQPGDGLHRLRHLRPAVLRAADRRGRAGSHCRGTGIGHGGRCHRDPRRADPAQVGLRPDGASIASATDPASGSRSPCSEPPPTPSISPRTADASATCWPGPDCPRRRSAWPPPSPRRSRRPSASATRCWSGRRTCSAVAACRSSTTSHRLADYISRATEITDDHPVLVDRFLDDAIEIDVDALCDGTEVYLGGVMEHIEEAGIHSGDSACVLPPITLGRSDIERVRSHTEAIALGGGVVGLLNVQYALKDQTLYVLEANPGPVGRCRSRPRRPRSRWPRQRPGSWRAPPSPRCDRGPAAGRG